MSTSLKSVVPLAVVRWPKPLQSSCILTPSAAGRAECRTLLVWKLPLTVTLGADAKLVAQLGGDGDRVIQVDAGCWSGGCLLSRTHLFVVSSLKSGQNEELRACVCSQIDIRDRAIGVS
jgi:hypothetical protein